MIFKVLLTSILITVNVINARLNAVNEQQYSQLRFRREADNCGEGYKPGTFYGCSDIDECYENETICGNLKCINTEGSYKCVESGKDETATGTIDVITDKEETHAKNTGDCEKGFKRDWFGSCEDIDECSENSTICGSAKCMNTEGGYECEGEVNLETTTITTEDTTALNIDVFTEKTDTHDKKVGYCDEGYERGWFGSCDDIDECSKKTHNCSENEKCENKVGSFACICLDENLKDTSGRCSTAKSISCDSNPCSHECRQIENRFECLCPSGYELESNRRNCIDINECELENSACEHDCRNTLGSFNCDCREGFKLVNETHCVEDCGGNGCTTTDYSEFDNLKEKQRYGEIEEEKEVNHVLIDTKTGDVKNLKCPIGYYYNKETEVCEDIDECVTSLHNCEFDRECRNTVGAFVCEECEEGAVRLPNGTCEIPRCYPGYEYSDAKQKCVDFDECKNIVPCGEQPCWNVDGAYFCACTNGNCGTNGYNGYKKGCIPGFKPSTRLISRCEDENECLSSSEDTCGSEQECVNTFGGYYCRCKPGMQRDRQGRCSDIDECVLFPSICTTNCVNTYGSYYCHSLDNRQREENRCKGFLDKRTGRCIGLDDIQTQKTNESDLEEEDRQKTTTVCDSKECEIEDGCEKGFKRDSYGVCKDIDECRDEDVCGDLRCENTNGGYRCVDEEESKTCDGRECKLEDGCETGFKRDSYGACRDLDECRDEDICGALRCLNTYGSYRCVAKQESMNTCEGRECNPNEKKDQPHIFKKCELGYTMNRNGVCEDIDECIEDVCPDDKLCKNTPGSFVCNEDHENLVAFEKCSIGYFFNKHSNTCEDIDECQLEIDNCMEFGCENTIGSYKCIEQKCFPGFELINGVCEDINECQRLGVSACLPNETCINSKGLYFCQKCKQVETVYRCYSRKQCLLGYEPLQYQCVDVDECKIGLFDCTDEEQCVNTIPGYRCDCRPGYTRNRSNKKCEKSHSNCGMDNICPDLTQEFPCPIGYQLSVDKLKCEDIDECLYERCAEGETCVNLRGGHRCYIN